MHPTRNLLHRRGTLSRTLLSLTLLCALAYAAPIARADPPPAGPDSAAARSESSALPGAEPYPEQLRLRLQRALADKDSAYQPRTEHLDDDGRPVYTNRLILEDSPYLLQHAHNPVNWYSWGREAFAAAAREHKPVFLSIGYSTCHWCHVMERESFDNPKVAGLLNENFIAVKVDRERRPEVDEIYMTAAQIMTGRGGWPLSSFLTAERQPFFAATYIPPEQFRELLQRVNEVWDERRDDIVASAQRVAAAIREVTAVRQQADGIDAATVDSAIDELVARHAEEHGPFGAAPKFPREPELLLLLDHALRTGDREALRVAEERLAAIAHGGIFDQVGGGFHRYSTDPDWRVPHFEKMMYNQAHLARAYLQVYGITGKTLYARIARQTLDYVLREMQAPSGGFYSATDADSEGEEGTFFLWTPAQLRAALSPEDGAFAIELFGATDYGDLDGKSVLHLAEPLAVVAEARGESIAVVESRVDRIRDTLRRVRETREHPLRDDKIVTAWNAMMITTLATGFDILGEDRYLEAARRAAEFLWARSRSTAGELYRVNLHGTASVAAGQEDYAFLAEALVSLYDSTGDERWLARARDLADRMLAKFWDAAGGGFFMATADTDPLLIAQPKSPMDSDMPSGNSVAMRTLAMLAARTGDPDYEDKAQATLGAFAGAVNQVPSAFAYMLIGTEHLRSGLAGNRQYAAGGNVSTRAVAADDGGVRVSISIRDGWHINANEPLQDYLKPTVISLGGPGRGWTLTDVRYPEPETVTLGFQDEALAVYQGDAVITAMLRPEPAADNPDATAVALRLHVQACNDEICLLPEQVDLELPIVGLGAMELR